MDISGEDIFENYWEEFESVDIMGVYSEKLGTFVFGPLTSKCQGYPNKANAACRKL